MIFKRIFCLLLTLVMVFSFAGCGSEEQTEPDSHEDSGEAILGDWYFEIELTEQITGTSKVTLEPVPVCFSFRNGGTLLLYMDEDTKESTAQEFDRQVLEILDDAIYSEREQAGHSREEIDELFAKTYGMSVEKYKRDFLADSDIRGRLDALADEYLYHADEKLLTIDGIPMQYTIDGDTLTITDCSDPNFWLSVGLELPVVMTKKD